MIIKDFIMTQPIEEITNEFIKINNIDASKFDKVLEKLQELIEKLSKYDVTPSEDILTVKEVNTDDENYLGVTLYLKKELLEWKDSPKFNKIYPTIDEIFKLTLEELEPLVSKINYPEKYCITFIPWKDALSYQINERNVKQIGGVAYVTAYLNKLTFFGFCEEDMIVKKEDLDQSIIEFEEIQKLPEEEREKHFSSAEEFFAELGINDDTTDEEEAEEDLKRNRELLISEIETHNLLKLIVEDLN